MELETIKIYIKNNLANGSIRPFKSPIRALIFFDKKLHGSLRLYINYQGLNNLTIKNRYPLLLVGKSLDWLGWTWHFTQLNLTNAYHWIQIKKRDKWLTVFKTHYGYFEYQVLFFGLTNLSAINKGYINKILAEKLDVFVIVYLDDIFIYIKNEGEKYVKVVKWVLNKLWKYLLYVNLKKC